MEVRCVSSRATETQVRAQVSQFGICGGQFSTGTVLSPCPSVLAVIVIAPLIRIHSHTTREMNRGPLEAQLHTKTKCHPTVPTTNCISDSCLRRE